MEGIAGLPAGCSAGVHTRACPCKITKSYGFSTRGLNFAGNCPAPPALAREKRIPLAVLE
jgi:hypothetical protein